MRILFFFLFIFLLLNIASPLAYPPIEDVTSHNMEIANSLINTTENVGGSPTNAPTVDDPVSFFSMRVFTALPSVDERISSNHIPLMLWGWGEQHEEKVEEERKTPNCPDSVITVESNGNPVPGEFSALVQFQDEERSADLLNGSKNPFPIPFSKEELDVQIEKDNETNRSKPLYLNITIAGSLSFTYARTEHTYTYECETVWINETNSIEVCTCHPVTYESNITIEKTASSSHSFLLENGNVLFFLLKPILREQLKDESAVNAVIFSKRLPYKAYLKFDDNVFNAVYTNSFSIEEDGLGVQYIKSAEDFHKGISPDDKDITNSTNLNSSLSFSSLETYLRPIQLEKENESFSNIYGINSSYANMSGRHNLSMLFFDHFNDRYEYNENVLTRTMTLISIERKEDGLEIRLGDDKGNALSNKKVSLLIDGKEEEHLTDGRGLILISNIPSFISAWFPGDDYYRPSSNYLTIRAQSGIIDLSIFGFLIILLALFAGMSFHNTRSIFPLSWLQRIFGFFSRKR